jgi:hypothetical protein
VENVFDVEEECDYSGGGGGDEDNSENAQHSPSSSSSFLSASSSLPSIPSIISPTPSSSLAVPVPPTSGKRPLSTKLPEDGEPQTDKRACSTRRDVDSPFVHKASIATLTMKEGDVENVFDVEEECDYSGGGGGDEDNSENAQHSPSSSSSSFLSASSSLPSIPSIISPTPSSSLAVPVPPTSANPLPEICLKGDFEVFPVYDGDTRRKLKFASTIHLLLQLVIQDRVIHSSSLSFVDSDVNLSDAGEIILAKLRSENINTEAVSLANIKFYKSDKPKAKEIKNHGEDLHELGVLNGGTICIRQAVRSSVSTHSLYSQTSALEAKEGSPACCATNSASSSSSHREACGALAAAVDLVHVFTAENILKTLIDQFVSLVNIDRQNKSSKGVSTRLATIDHLSWISTQGSNEQISDCIVPIFDGFRCLQQDLTCMINNNGSAAKEVKSLCRQILPHLNGIIKTKCGEQALENLTLGALQFSRMEKNAYRSPHFDPHDISELLVSITIEGSGILQVGPLNQNQWALNVGDGYILSDARVVGRQPSLKHSFIAGSEGRFSILFRFVNVATSTVPAIMSSSTASPDAGMVSGSGASPDAQVSGSAASQDTASTKKKTKEKKKKERKNS